MSFSLDILRNKLDKIYKGKSTRYSTFCQTQITRVGHPNGHILNVPFMLFFSFKNGFLIR